jgi:hypothetical protein
MQVDGTDRSAFVAYPTNRVVGTLARPADVQAATDMLHRAGFEPEDIDVLRTEDDLRRLDASGKSRGFLAHLERTLLRASGSVEEFQHARQHIADIRAGRIVVMVHAPERDRRRLAASILNAHHATFVDFYGRWAWEALEADTGSPDPAPGRTYQLEIEGQTVRAYLESTETARIFRNGAGSPEGVRAASAIVRTGVSLMTWPDGDAGTIVAALDHEGGTVQAMAVRGAEVRRLTGTLRRIG